MELQPGLIVDQFRITGRLGQGGMADVYAAEDLKLPRRVALKGLPGVIARDKDAVARFHREVKAAASLDHNGIVQIIQVGQIKELELPYFAMRLLSGGDLTSRIAKGIAVARALMIVGELAGAFAHAHARGFVHRDVKPANILFNEQDYPVPEGGKPPNQPTARLPLKLGWQRASRNCTRLLLPLENGAWSLLSRRSASLPLHWFFVRGPWVNPRTFRPHLRPFPNAENRRAGASRESTR